MRIMAFILFLCGTAMAQGPYFTHEWEDGTFLACYQNRDEQTRWYAVDNDDELHTVVCTGVDRDKYTIKDKWTGRVETGKLDKCSSLARFSDGICGICYGAWLMLYEIGGEGHGRNK